MADVITTLAQGLLAPPLDLLSMVELTPGPVTGFWAVDDPIGYGFCFQHTLIPDQFGYQAGSERRYYQWLSNWSLTWYGRTSVNQNNYLYFQQYYPIGGQPLVVSGGGRLGVQFAPGVYGRVYALQLT